MFLSISIGGDLKLDKGPQRLDGAHAEIIVRHRGAEGTSDGNYALGDISRLQVQRLFMAAVMKQVMGLSKTEMLGMIPTLLNYFSTDLTPAEMMGFFGKGKRTFYGRCDDVFIARRGNSAKLFSLQCSSGGDSSTFKPKISPVFCRGFS